MAVGLDLLAVLVVVLTKSKIMKCYQFQVLNPHPDNYSLLDINQPSVGVYREAHTHSYVINFLYNQLKSLLVELYFITSVSFPHPLSYYIYPNVYANTFNFSNSY